MSDDSRAAIIDAATFADLQAAAGEDFVKELIDTFLEEAPPMLDALRNAIKAGNADAFRRTAHSLKSNSHTFGALSLGAMARDLEMKGMPADAASLDALATEYSRVATALTELRDA